MKKWECSVCGYIHIGEEPPDECPVCGADSSKFAEVIEVAAENVKKENSPETNPGMFDKLVQLMLKHHLHPIAVHTPNGIVPAAALFLFLAMGLKMSSFEVPAFYNMVFVLLAMPVVLFTGFIEWQKTYKGARTSIFVIKISCGAVVLVSLIILVAWRMINPDVAGPESSAKWLYFLLHLLVLSAVILAGNLGGKLVFGRRK